MDKTTLNRVAQLEAARPADDEDLTITQGMDPVEATRRYKRSLSWPGPQARAKSLTPEQRAKLTPERATAIYRASLEHPDATTDELERIADEALAKPAPVVEPVQEPTEHVLEPDPLGWLDEAEAWQAEHPGELHADRNGPPDDDEYRDPPQEAAPEPDEQPEPTPTPVPLANQPENDDWLLY